MSAAHRDQQSTDAGSSPDRMLLRFRYNTMAAQTPNGEFIWRVIVERDGVYEEFLVKRLIVNVPSFSTQDDMPVVGVKCHIACYGHLRIEDDVAIVD